jgi:tetraacyldisaccharide 4'-kinase
VNEFGQIYSLSSNLIGLFRNAIDEAIPGLNKALSMKIVRLLLYPFAALYNLATTVRNYLYDIGHKPSFQFDIPVITIGNLNVGGSGKTPMVEYLISLLKQDVRVATLSRGYRRDTKGYRIATASDTVREIGDEPMQLFKKFGSDISVVVGEDRVFAIPNILHEFPETNVIILDDALQHRSVRSKLCILVTDCAHPFYSDFVLPFGRLRESRRGARRSDIIVVSKCPEDIATEKKQLMTESIQRYAGPKPVFFSTIHYGAVRPIATKNKLTHDIVLVSGIAKADSLKLFCGNEYNVLKHFDFGDHHRYTPDDLQSIENYCKSHPTPVSIITTEKDMVKLVEPALRPHVERLPWFYIPIQHVFVEDGLKFDELVRAAVKVDQKN